MTQSTIIVHQVVKHYGAIEALKGVSLSVDQGKILGLLGANGAGKTTLIRILIGATAPTEGHTSVLGLDSQRQTYAVRQVIGYMPQSPALYDDLSARQNVRFFAQPHRLADLESHIDEVLAFVDLTARQHDPVYGFSGGMKQRVSLACALVHQPQVLLLDEPTAGIDPQLREIFWSHFRQLADSGTTILISTHQMDEAMHCDQLAIMRAGEVLAYDTPANIMRRGRSRVTIYRGDQAETKTLTDYRHELVELLKTQGLDTIDRIDIEEDTLEAIVLGLIQTQQ